MTATTTDYERELKRYAFTDRHDHPLENCTEFRALLEELRFLRDANSVLKYNWERAITLLLRIDNAGYRYTESSQMYTDIREVLPKEKT